MDHATVEILLKAKEEGLDAIRDMKDALQDLRRQAEETNAILGVMALSGFATQNAITLLADAMTKVGPANQAASQGAAQSTSVFGQLGGVVAFLAANIAVVLVSLGVLALLLIGPLVIALAGVIVLTTAFAVGVTAVAASLALAFLPLAALSFGVVALADRLGLVNGPMAALKDSISDMADKWGTKAAPMATQMINWLDSLVPKVQAVGLSLLDWFGQRLPMIMQIAGQTVTTLLGAFQQLGTVIGNFIDTMAGIGRATSNLPALQQMFALMLGVGVQAVTGLLSNLVQLSDWFLQRLPQLGPIIATIFGAMGSGIQEVAKKAGELVDWFIKNWPEISKQAAQVWSVMGPILGRIIQWAGDAVDWFVKNWPKIRDTAIWVFDQLKAGWDSVAPVFAVLIPAAGALVAFTFDYLSKHTELVTAVIAILQLGLFLIGGALGVTAVLIIALGLAASGIILVVGDLARAIGNLADKLSSAQGLAYGLAKALAILTHSAPPTIAITGPGSAGGTGAGGSASGGPMLAAQHGGMIPGLPGAPVVIQAHAGEVVLSPNLLEAMVGLLQQIAENTTQNSIFSTSAYGRA